MSSKRLHIMVHESPIPLLIVFLLSSFICATWAQSPPDISPSNTSVVQRPPLSREQKRAVQEKKKAAETGEQYILEAIMKGYDHRVRPRGLNTSWEETGGPVVVIVNILIRSISKIDDFNMEYSTQITFREQWVDERLAFGQLNLKMGKGRKELPDFVTLPPGGHVWMPDTFFQNEKQARKHDIDTPNVLIRIHKDGGILYSVRISLVLSCPMMLHDYPMDVQKCLMDLASYAYTTNDIKYVWKEETPIQIRSQVNNSLPSFELAAVTTDYCTSKTTTLHLVIKAPRFAGEYGCLRVAFTLRRQFSYFFVQLYIPSIMLIIVSWVSFWLDRTSVPGRVALGVTTLLTMTTQASGVNAKLPPVSYTKAIDIWIGACMAFIFGSLLEFACVTYVGDKDLLAKKRKAEQDAKDAEKKKEKDGTKAEPNPLVANLQGLQGPGSLRLRPASGPVDASTSPTKPLLPTTSLPQFHPIILAPVGLKCDPECPKYSAVQMQGNNIENQADMPRPLRRNRWINKPKHDNFCLHMLMAPIRFIKKKINEVGDDRSKKIDFCSRFAFPSGFILFNVVYWSVFKS